MSKVTMLQDHVLFVPTIEDGRTINKRLQLRAGEIYEGERQSELVDARKAKFIIEEEPKKKPPAAKRQKKVVTPAETKAKSPVKKAETKKKATTKKVK